MKVILTVHQFFPEHGSGTEVLTLETAKALRDLGHEVWIVTGIYRHEQLEDHERFDQYLYQGFLVHRFAFSPSPIWGDSNYTRLEHDNPLFSEKFGELLDQIQPDVVHFFHLMRLSASFVDECVSRGVPTVLTPTDFWFVCPYAQLMLPDHSTCSGPDRGAINCIRHFMDSNRKASIPYAWAASLPDAALRLGLKAVERNLHLRLPLPGVLKTLGEHARAVSARPQFLTQRLGKVDRLVVPNQFMLDLLLRYGAAPEQSILQPYGINLEYQGEIAHIPSPVFRIGFIGTLARHKGAHVLIEAVKRLRGAHCELKIYGYQKDNPQYYEEIQQLAAGDGRVRFLGGFPNNEIGKIFSELDVLVVPSIWLENTPLVIYSAQAAACPVVGSDVGGIGSAVLHEENGLLFPPGDIQALAHALERMMSEHGLRDRLAQQCKPPISIHEYAEVLDQQYREFAGARQ